MTEIDQIEITCTLRSEGSKMDGKYIKTLIGILNQNRSLTAISRLGTSKLVGHSDFHNGENAKSIMK